MSLRQIIKEELEKLLNEYVVPVSYTLEDWKAFRKKHNVSNAEYHKKHPSLRWKVVHGHKKGQIGDSLKGMSDMSYQEATKAHAAIAMRTEQVTPVAGLSTSDISKATLSPAQKQTQDIVDIISKNSAVVSKLKTIDTPEELDAFLEAMTNLITMANKGSLNNNEITRAVKQMYTIKRT